MSCNPTQVWNRLSPAWQTRIRADLTVLFQEVIDAQLRSHYPPTSDPQGRHLQPAIGFRPRLYGMTHDVASLAVPGVPTVIDAVMPTPTAAVMQRLLEGLRTTRRKAP